MGPIYNSADFLLQASAEDSRMAHTAGSGASLPDYAMVGWPRPEPRIPRSGTSSERMRAVNRLAVAVAAIAALVFALAFFSPVETVDTDPAIALLASQAIVDYHTLALEPYRFPDRSAYDLYGDYRIRRITGGTYYYSIGVPILSAPAVWVANRFGWHMLDQHAEFATQNALSALSCAILFVLLFQLCRSFATPAASLTIATVSMLGTSLMSTGATALWTTDYSLIFVTLALLRLTQRELGDPSRWDVVYVAVMVTAGFLCRPATGLFGIGCAVYFLGDRDRVLARAAAAALGGVALVFVLSWIMPMSLVHNYYSPARLWPVNPLGEGIHHLLISPSRGLFVFSPFLLLVAAGAAWQLPRLRHNQMFWLSVSWIVLHVVFSAVKKGKWWAGHSFGPRALVDIIPAFVVLTCLLWRELPRAGPALRLRNAGMAGYVALGAAAIVLHSGQALFNPATRLWNAIPDIDRFPDYALDWRYPQFLATAALLDARLDDHEIRLAREAVGRLETYQMGQIIPFDAGTAVFVDWYDPETHWRWSRGTASSIIVKLGPEVAGHALYLLEITAQQVGQQRVRVGINGTTLDTIEFSERAMHVRPVVVPGRLLIPDAPNTITFEPSAPTSTPDDPRQMAVAFQGLRLAALPADVNGVRFGDDAYFGEGFSAAEKAFRWTDGGLARLFYPMGAVADGGSYWLEIKATSYGPQRAELLVNGTPVGDVTLSGLGLESVGVAVPRRLLKGETINNVELRLPDAVSPPGDPRRLALAITWVGIVPAPAGSAPANSWR